MKNRFSRNELLGATRQILTEIAAWTDTIYDVGAAERLLGTMPGRDTEWDDGGVAACIERTLAVEDRDWDKAGSAGPIIEHSIVLKQLARVIDFLNTNIWHGDSSNFRNTMLALTPFQLLLEATLSSSGIDRKIPLAYAIDDAIDLDAASSVFAVLKIFFARVAFELDSVELTLAELATISGLAEKTVRMAAIGQDKNPDLVTFKDGRSTFVKIEEARRWLKAKNIDYRSPEYTQKQLLPQVEPKSLGELGAYLRTVREASGMSLDELRSRLDWDNGIARVYKAIEDGALDIDLTPFSLEVVIHLAQALCPAESRNLVRAIDWVVHPLFLDRQIKQVISASDKKERNES